MSHGVPPVPVAPAEALAARTRPAGRDSAVDGLRSFANVLVVFFHAALAYTSFRAAAIVDPSHTVLLDPFAGHCDTFFMPLLFLVSGLFTLPSLERKGSGGYFVARLKRLGIPFVVFTVIVSPLTFLAPHLATSPQPSVSYWKVFLVKWPNAPLWFLWVLLAFNGIIALVNRLAPTVLARLRRQPTALFVLLATVVSCAPFIWYVPGLHWVTVGPFQLEPPRIGLYFVYFLIGAALGGSDRWRDKGWPKLWWCWFALGMLSFGAYGLLMYEAIPATLSGGGARPLASQAVITVAFAASCAGTCLGLIGAFRRFVKRRNPVLDSLSANAYGIYLFHLGFVYWLQYALLSAPLPALVKFGTVSIGALALSWGATALVRLIPAVRRVI